MFLGDEIASSSWIGREAAGRCLSFGLLGWGMGRGEVGEEEDPTFSLNPRIHSEDWEKQWPRSVRLLLETQDGEELGKGIPFFGN